MTVSELIEFLKTQPQDLLVAYDRYSEHVLLKDGDVSIGEACEPRPDGWLQRKRPDKRSRQCLFSPGN